MTEPPVLTPAERALIRTEFMERFGQVRGLSDGILLRRWGSGPLKGQPKLPKAVAGLLARGLVAIEDRERGWPCARFTPAGLAALRLMAADARQLDPAKYRHLLAELAALAPQDVSP